MPHCVECGRYYSQGAYNSARCKECRSRITHVTYVNAPRPSPPPTTTTTTTYYVQPPQPPPMTTTTIYSNPMPSAMSMPMMAMSPPMPMMTVVPQPPMQTTVYSQPQMYPPPQNTVVYQTNNPYGAPFPGPYY